MWQWWAKKVVSFFEEKIEGWHPQLPPWVSPTHSDATDNSKQNLLNANKIHVTEKFNRTSLWTYKFDWTSRSFPKILGLSSFRKCWKSWFDTKSHILQTHSYSSYSAKCAGLSGDAGIGLLILSCTPMGSIGPGLRRLRRPRPNQKFISGRGVFSLLSFHSFSFISLSFR